MGTHPTKTSSALTSSQASPGQTRGRSSRYVRCQNCRPRGPRKERRKPMSSWPSPHQYWRHRKVRPIVPTTVLTRTLRRSWTRQGSGTANGRRRGFRPATARRISSMKSRSFSSKASLMISRTTSLGSMESRARSRLKRSLRSPRVVSNAGRMKASMILSSGSAPSSERGIARKQLDPPLDEMRGVTGEDLCKDPLL